MKAKRKHIVPLSDAALAVVKKMSETQLDELVFPGAREGRPLSDMSLTASLRRMGRGDLTAHGFRSSFCDWAAERTNFPNHVVEMALAHTIGNKVEAAYRRDILLAKRVALMRAWASYCATVQTPGDVVPMKRHASAAR